MAQKVKFIQIVAMIYLYVQKSGVNSEMGNNLNPDQWANYKEILNQQLKDDWYKSPQE